MIRAGKVVMYVIAALGLWFLIPCIFLVTGVLNESLIVLMAVGAGVAVAAPLINGWMSERTHSRPLLLRGRSQRLLCLSFFPF
jgi:hypothetical protein